MASLLSRTTKMPGHSFSISTEHCQTGSKLRELSNSVCSRCYAHYRGLYRMPNVVAAQKERFDELKKAFKNKERREAWIGKMAAAINRTRSPYFRWHDAGDLQSKDHFLMICEVARRTPTKRHWLPTKEYTYIVHDEIPENLVVRKSSFMINRAPTGSPGLWNFTFNDPKSVPKSAHICPAYERTPASCGPCRACWNPKIKIVALKEH